MPVSTKCPYRRKARIDVMPVSIRAYRNARIDRYARMHDRIAHNARIARSDCRIARVARIACLTRIARVAPTARTIRIARIAGLLGPFVLLRRPDCHQVG